MCALYYFAFTGRLRDQRSELTLPHTAVAKPLRLLHLPGLLALLLH
jgi:hypothetical protein